MSETPCSERRPYVLFLMKKGGQHCCHLAAALLYARDKWILIFWFGLSFELLFVVWWFLLGHVVSVRFPTPFWFLALVATFSVHLESNLSAFWIKNSEVERTLSEMLKDISLSLETQVYWSAEEREKWYFCTEMNANVLIQHFVNITHPHSTQHPDYLVWSENHERHKLVKMKIQIGTKKFKQMHSEGRQDGWIGKNPQPKPTNHSPLSSRISP